MERGCFPVQNRIKMRFTHSFWMKTLLAGTLLLPFLPVDVHGESSATPSKTEPAEMKPEEILKARRSLYESIEQITGIPGSDSQLSTNMNEL